MPKKPTTVRSHSQRCRKPPSTRADIPTSSSRGGDLFPSIARKPILFSKSMVLAILDGSKGQTRRLVTENTSLVGARWRRLDFARAWVDAGYVKLGGDAFLKAPMLDAPGDPGDDRFDRVRCRIQHGDRLWVRETWATEKKYDRRRPSRVPVGARIWFLADGPKPKWAGRGRPSIFMMPWMSRIELLVDHVRVERVNQISEVDAAKEGVSLYVGCPCEGDDEEPGPHVKLCRWNRKDWPSETPLGVDDPNRMAFAVLWDSINKKRFPFDDGAWVWAICFSRTKP